MNRPSFALLAIFLFLASSHLVTANDLTGDIDGAIPAVGGFAWSLYGPYTRISCFDCPWYLKGPFILVPGESKSQDPVKLRAGIARETKTREFDKAPVISIAEYYGKAIKAYPQYRELIEKEQLFVQSRFSADKLKSEAVAYRLKKYVPKKSRQKAAAPAQAPQTP
ncbi:MAG: hypothetical protein AAB320_03565 [Elusimicrobiota bacterium]